MGEIFVVFVVLWGFMGNICFGEMLGDVGVGSFGE